MQFSIQEELFEVSTSYAWATLPILMGWWKSDGGTPDYSGLDNHGTAFGDPTYVLGMGQNSLEMDTIVR